jgi:hypothetical protein
MLSDTEAHGFEKWVAVARACADSAQGYVGASGELAVASRDLADGLDGESSALSADEAGRGSLAEALRLLAGSVEKQSQELRDGYPLTEETLNQLRSIAGSNADE